MEAFQQLLAEQGLSDTWIRVVMALSKGLALLLVAWGANFVTKRILLRVMKSVIERSQTTFDDELIRHRVLDRVANLVPIVILYLGTSWVLSDYPSILAASHAVVVVISAVLGVAIINGLLNAGLEVYRTFEVSRKLPMTGVVQILKFVVIVMAVLGVLSQLLGRSPLVLFSGLGALSAITMLVFRDPILGLVSGIQLTTNNMVEVGDWIEVPSDGIDGDVVEVNLTTVMVQNFDKTISTIPAYKLMNGHFRNWRGMKRSGGRRIKRTLIVDMSTIRYCDRDMLDRFKKVKFITEYVDKKIAEVEAYNREQNVDESVLINGRRLTNVGTFRAYVTAYLRNHPKVHKEMTFLVRHLEPATQGLPIQIYVFSNEQVWARYEEIQADIFDHLLAAAPLFDLRIYQEPSSGDFQSIAESLRQRA